MDLQKITTLKADLEAAYLAEKARLEFFRLEVSAGGFWVVRDVADGAVAGRKLRGHVNFAPESVAAGEVPPREAPGARERRLHEIHEPPLGIRQRDPHRAPGPRDRSRPGDDLSRSGHGGRRRALQSTWEFNLAIPPATLPTVNVPGYRIDWVLEFALVVDSGPNPTPSPPITPLSS